MSKIILISEKHDILTRPFFKNHINHYLHGEDILFFANISCFSDIRIIISQPMDKYEDVFIQAYSTLPEAKQGIRQFIEHYNFARPHQALGYRTPSELYIASTPGLIAGPGPLGYL